MSETKALDDIWESYQTTLDCLQVASREISKGTLDALEKTGFLNTPVDVARQKIQTSRDTADDHVILSLWAVFERSLVAHLQNENRRLLSEPTTNLTRNIHQKIDEELEYWRTEDVLNIFKAAINPDLIGQAKQVKKYRDWVAHKNPKKLPPSNIPPEAAYKLLCAISTELGSTGP
jgi:hypothetical protein